MPTHVYLVMCRSFDSRREMALACYTTRDAAQRRISNMDRPMSDEADAPTPADIIGVRFYIASIPLLLVE